MQSPSKNMVQSPSKDTVDDTVNEIVSKKEKSRYKFDGFKLCEDDNQLKVHMVSVFEISSFIVFSIFFLLFLSST